MPPLLRILLIASGILLVLFGGGYIATKKHQPRPIEVPQAVPAATLATWYERCTESQNRTIRFEACFVVVRDEGVTPEQLAVAYALICQDIATMNEWEYAKQLCSKAQALAPHPRTLANLGLVEYKLKHFDQALDALNRAIAEDPTLVNAYINRRLVYLELGDQPKADADLAKAKELGAKER